MHTSTAGSRALHSQRRPPFQTLLAFCGKARGRLLRSVHFQTAPTGTACLRSAPVQCQIVCNALLSSLHYRHQGSSHTMSSTKVKHGDQAPSVQDMRLTALTACGCYMPDTCWPLSQEPPTWAHGIPLAHRPAAAALLPCLVKASSPFLPPPYTYVRNRVFPWPPSCSPIALPFTHRGFLALASVRYRP